MIIENPSPEEIASMSPIERKRLQNRRWQRRVWSHRQEYMKEYYAKNREKIKAKTSARYHADPASHIRKNIAYVKKNAAKKRQWFAGYRDKNRPKILAKQLEWREKNRGKWAGMSSRRRAMVRNVTINLAGIEDWMQRMRRLNFVNCYYCRRLLHSCDIHFDHVIPISRGGPHAIENLCVSCPGCNLSKGPKMISEWDNKPELILDL
jgi:5-methylcytosine-specific restriction endonuclease McrA